MRASMAALLMCAWLASAADASDAIWEALRAPGSVVIVRHSYAPGTFDPPDAKLEDCSTQRNLDDNGRAQARHIGEAFRAHGIAVGVVRSSPRCRRARRRIRFRALSGTSTKRPATTAIFESCRGRARASVRPSTP